MASTAVELLRRRFGGKKGGLPSGYTQYDWVQADSTTGVPAIDTGLVPNLSLLWTFEGKFARTDDLPNNYSPTWLFSRVEGGNYSCNYALGRYSRYSNLLAFNYNSRANSETFSGHPSADINIGEWHTFLLQPSEGISYGGELILDGVVTTYSQSRPNNTADTLKILTANTSSNVPYPCRFAEFKVKYDGALVADLIPAKRDADDVVGFYDVVRNTFYAPTTEGVTLLCGYGFEDFNT